MNGGRLVGWWLLAAALLPAQEKLRVDGPSPATVVLGSSARVDLIVDGRDAEPERPEVPDVPGLGCRLMGPSRQLFSQIGPGGMTQQSTVTWQLLLTPQREGTFTIPAFAMNTGTRRQEVPAITLSAVKELRGAEFGYLQVALERPRVYVHEPIRVAVRFGVDRTLRLVQNRANNGQDYVDVEVQAPWLSAMPGAESLEEPKPTGEQVPVVLNRTLQLAAYDATEQRGNKNYHAFRYRKSFLPTRTGTFTLDAPMLRYDVQLQQGRTGIFGERLGGQEQNYYVYGEPLQVEVLPIPEAGRPSPYFGAVGRFTIEAALDRDTVKVGSSIKVTLAIRGTGNLEFLRVPELESFAAVGLHKLAQTKALDHDKVVVTYDLTPLHADVKEIPAIEWNWFDTTPGVERFVSAATRPLPIVVQPLAAGESIAPLDDGGKQPVTPGVDDIFDLPDLGGPPVLAPALPDWAPWTAAFGPWLGAAALAVALLLRRRYLADPLAVRRRKAQRVCEQALADGQDPTAALAGYLGDRLGTAAAAVIGPDLQQRLLAAGLDAELAAAVVRAIELGVAGRYGGSGGLDQQAVRALVAQLEGARLRAGARGRALLPLLLALALPAASGGALRAQTDEAVAAYRRGDYAAAEPLFAAAFERTGDRRLWAARGNCFYRLDRLPAALWAYECARLGLPRDRELLANIALVRKRLELGGEASAPFLSALAAVRDRWTVLELAWACAGCMVLAAALLLLRARPAWRWAAAPPLGLGALLALELLWLRPQRPALAIALEPLALTAEARAGMQPVATVQPGVTVAVRSRGTGEWARVEVEGHSGYAPQRQLRRVE